jgi:tetratricopeptide (TPR) repeat protein
MADSILEIKKQAQDLREEGKLNESIKLFEDNVDLARKEKFSNYFAQMGVTYRLLDKFDEALDCYEAAKELASKNSVELANVLRDQALTIDDMILQNKGDHNHLQSQKLLKQSLKILKNQKENDPAAFAATACKLGLNYAYLCKFKKGKSMITEAIQLMKDHKFAYFYYSFHLDLAKVLLLINKEQEAVFNANLAMIGCEKSGHTHRANSAKEFIVQILKDDLKL